MLIDQQQCRQEEPRIVIVGEQLDRAARVLLGIGALAAREVCIRECVVHARVLRVELLGGEELAQRERAAAVREMIAAHLEPRRGLARVQLRGATTERRAAEPRRSEARREPGRESTRECPPHRPSSAAATGGLREPRRASGTC